MTEKTTNMSPEWVQSLLTAYPCTKLESGNIRTCIARLSFPHLFKPQPPMEAGGKEKFTATLLFPVGADLSVLKQAAAECAIEKWPNAGKPGGRGRGRPPRDVAGVEVFHRVAVTARGRIRRRDFH